MSALLTVTEVYSVIVFKRFWKVQYVRQQKTLADFWRLLLYLGVFINGAGTGQFKPLIVKQADPVHPPAPLPFLSIFSSHMKRGPFWGHWSCSQAKVLPLRSPPGKPGQHIKALDSRQTPQRPLQGRGSGLNWSCSPQQTSRTKYAVAARKEWRQGAFLLPTGRRWGLKERHRGSVRFDVNSGVLYEL